MIGISVKLPLLPPHSLILSPSVCLSLRLCKVSVSSPAHNGCCFFIAPSLCVLLKLGHNRRKPPHKLLLFPRCLFPLSLSVLSRLSGLRYVYTKIALFALFSPSLYVISSLRSTAGSPYSTAQRHRCRPYVFVLCFL